MNVLRGRDGKGGRTGFPSGARRSGADLADGRPSRKKPHGHSDEARRPLDDHPTLSSLELEFDAALARDEEAAADDLAMSLDQDRGLDDLLRRKATSTPSRNASGPAEVTAFGTDYVRVRGTDGEEILPAHKVVFRLEDTGEPPSNGPKFFTDVARHLARSRARISIETPSGPFEGEVSRARPDHLQLETKRGSLLVPYDAIDRLKIRRGG